MSNSAQLSPTDVFAIASGIEPLALKLTFSFIFVMLLLLAYAWAAVNGYGGLSKPNGIWDFVKIVLWGAALVLIVVNFFIY